MKLIEKQSKQTFKDKKGVEKNYVNFYLVADNGKSVQIKCAFNEGYAVLPFLVGVDVTLFKKQSQQTYNNKNGKECHYYNYWLGNAEKPLVQIRCAYADDYAKIDMLAIYVK